MKTKIILFFFLLLCCNKMLLAQAGSLDKSFSGDGKVITTGPNNSLAASAFSMAVQKDGKIVVAGNYSDGTTSYFLVVRYNSNGTLDNSFGLNGRAGIDFFGADAGANAVAIQPDGKIVVAGTAYPDIAVTRLNTDGTLDQSFSTDGKVLTSVSYGAEAYAMAIQADGKIVVAGDYVNASSDEDFVVVRYNSNGTLDNSFSGNGKAGIGFGGYDEAYAMAVQQDGKIVVAGFSDNSLFDMKFARLNTNGTLDNTFGVNGNGRVGIDFGGNDAANSVAIQTDGKIVVAGSSTRSGKTYFAVAKLSTGGKRISNFGVNGTVTTLIGISSFESSLAIQTDGKIVVAGAASAVFTRSLDFALARYNANGSLDNTFGNNSNGIVTTDFGGDDYAYAMAVQRDRKIVLAGESTDRFARIAVARYNGDPVSQTASSENISAATDKKLSASSSIKIFPNPAKDLLSIDGMDASTKTISIIDMNGRAVQTTTTTNSMHTWNIASLPAGTYYLLIDDKKNKTSLKFVKE